MRIQELLREASTGISIELYPPKSDTGLARLLQQLPQMAAYQPLFFSVTYGAGGSTRAGTRALCKHLRQSLKQEVLAHLTCIAHTKTEIIELLNWYHAHQIDKIMALRGDPPQHIPHTLCESELRYAVDLVRYLKAHTEHSIAVAGYPEPHPETPDYASSLRYQIEKIKAGAALVISQFFTENDRFLKWRDDLHRHRISVPIVPGILPVLSSTQLQRFAAFSQVQINPRLSSALDRFADQPESARKVGVEFALQQIEVLRAEGVPLIHLYALNSLQTLEAISAGTLSRSSADNGAAMRP